jgi:hypothetical protein
MMSSSSLSVLIETAKGALKYLTSGGKLDTEAIGKAVKATTAAFNSNPDMSDANKKAIEEATTAAMDGLSGEESKKGSEEGGAAVKVKKAVKAVKMAKARKKKRDILHFLACFSRLSSRQRSRRISQTNNRTHNLVGLMF